MNKGKLNKKPFDIMWTYVITTYLVFWLMVLGICGTAAMVFHASPFVMRILSNICAWSPTIVLFIMFRKLRPNMTLKKFCQSAFSGSVKWYLMILLSVVIAGGICLSIWFLSLLQGRNFLSYFTLGNYSLLTSFVLSLLSGPTGEEAGWRGYLRVELNKRYSFLKASILQGVIWAFWHTVLWFIDSDFMGLSMIPYVISNVIVMSCLAIVMNVVLEKNNNLLYAILIHFAFNFMYCFLLVDIWFYLILSVVYIFIAIVFLIRRGKDENDQKKIYY